MWDKIEDANKAIKLACGYIPHSVVSRYKSVKVQKRRLGDRKSAPRDRPGYETPKEVFEQCEGLYEKMLSDFTMTPGRIKNIISTRRWSRCRFVILGPPAAFMIGALIDAYYVEIQWLIATVLG